MEADDQEHSRGISARFDRMDGRIDQVGASTNRMFIAVLSVFGALAVAVIVSNIFG